MHRFSALMPFRVRSYRFQWPADLFTSWAFEMEALILGWYVLVETGSVVLLTLFGALQHGGTLVAPILGVVSDRIGPRNLLTAMRATYAVIAGTLMVLAFAGMLNPVIVLILVGMMGVLRPSDLGLRAALIADTMPPNTLTGAMGFNRVTSDSSRIAGALTGAGLFALLGMGPAYVVVVTFYALAALLTSQTDSAHSKAATVPVVAAVSGRVSTWSDLREGVVYIWNTPTLLAIVCFVLMFNAAAFPLTNGLLPYVAREIYLTDQTGLSYLVASISGGALVGALMISRLAARTSLTRLMVVAAIAWHVLLILFAQMQTMAGGIVTLMLAGVAQSLTMVSLTVVLVNAAGQRFRGRVMGVRMLAIYTLPLGLLLAGALIEHIGFGATATLYAVIGGIVTVIIALRWRAVLWAKPSLPDAPSQR
ncbi:MAG: MFS transporter [Xanthobacteraceae bacterium]